MQASVLVGVAIVNAEIVDDPLQRFPQLHDLLRRKALKAQRIHFGDERQQLGFEFLCARGEVDMYFAPIGSAPTSFNVARKFQSI